MRYLVFGIFALLISLSCLTTTGCRKKEAQKADTTNTDSGYVSDHFLNNTTSETPQPEPEPEPSHRHHRSSSGGGGHSRSSSPSTAGQVWSSKYQNYQRSGSSARDFAEAMVWHVIRMTYAEDFKAAKSRVLDSKTEDGTHTIEMEVVWSDEWVKNYTVRGTLTVKEDGSNARFTINERNPEAEALEFTHDNYQSSVSLEAI